MGLPGLSAHTGLRISRHVKSSGKFRPDRWYDAADTETRSEEEDHEPGEVPERACIQCKTVWKDLSILQYEAFRGRERYKAGWL